MELCAMVWGALKINPADVVCVKENAGKKGETVIRTTQSKYRVPEPAVDVIAALNLPVPPLVLDVGKPGEPVHIVQEQISHIERQLTGRSKVRVFFASGGKALDVASRDEPFFNQGLDRFIQDWGQQDTIITHTHRIGHSPSHAARLFALSSLLCVSVRRVPETRSLAPVFANMAGEQTGYPVSIRGVNATVVMGEHLKEPTRFAPGQFLTFDTGYPDFPLRLDPRLLRGASCVERKSNRRTLQTQYGVELLFEQGTLPRFVLIPSPSQDQAITLLEAIVPQIPKTKAAPTNPQCEAFSLV
jgi:hypothetical protein